VVPLPKGGAVAWCWRVAWWCQSGACVRHGNCDMVVQQPAGGLWLGGSVWHGGAPAQMGGGGPGGMVLAFPYPKEVG
jgi:hypothetical protein